VDELGEEVLEQLETDEEDEEDEEEWVWLRVNLGRGGVPSPEEEVDMFKLAHGEPRPPLATTVEPRETEDGL
jgi:hypothetical protein